MAESSGLEGIGNAVTGKGPAMSDYPQVPRGPLAQFTCFQGLPVELRLAIWKINFLPRIVIITSVGSACTCLPWASLLLVNREAHGVFLSNYALCFPSDVSDTQYTHMYTGHHRGVFINPKLDTLSMHGTGALHRKLATYPEQMGRLQWLDIYLSPVSAFQCNFSRDIKTDMSLMHSLRLVTICGQFSTSSVSSSGLSLVAKILDMFNGHTKLEWTRLLPNAKLALLLAPIDFGRLGMEDFRRAMSMSGRKFEQPSAMTYKRWSDTRSLRWGETWPAAPDKFEAEGWFAYEVSPKLIECLR